MNRDLEFARPSARGISAIAEPAYSSGAVSYAVDSSIDGSSFTSCRFDSPKDGSFFLCQARTALLSSLVGM